MSIPNYKRGEVKIELCGKTFILTPTYNAMAMIDGALRETFKDGSYTFDNFVHDIANGRPRISVSAAVIYGGIKGKDPRSSITLEEVQELIFGEMANDGYLKVSEACTVFSTMLFRGGKDFEYTEDDGQLSDSDTAEEAKKP